MNSGLPCHVGISALHVAGDCLLATRRIQQRFRFQFRAGAVCAAVLVAAASSAIRAEAPPDDLAIDVAIAAISNLEERVETVRFHCEVWRGSFVESERGWELTAETAGLPSTAIGVIHATSDVLLRPSLGMFRVNQDVLTQTLMSGATPEEQVRFVSRREDYSNDGLQFRRQARGTSTRERPDPAAAVESWQGAEEWKAAGVVSTVADEAVHLENKGFMQLYGHALGIGHVTPYVSPILEPPQRLSQLLQGKKEGGDYIAARVTSDGLWEIMYSIIKTFNPPYAFRVFYDPQRGRIARCEWGGCKECKEHGLDDWWVARVAEYRYADDAALIPTQVAVIDLTGAPVVIDGQPVKQGMQWVYGNSELNPPASEDDFRLAFDEGVEVMDHIDKKIYVVGSGLEQDQASIDQFLLYHGLNKPAAGQPAAPVPRVWTAWAVIAANGVALAVIIGVYYLRRRMVRILLLAAVLSPGSLSAQSPGQTRSRDLVPVRQCGHSVTMAVLRMREINYSVSVIESEMPPTDKGVSLAQIKRVLDAYGLAGAPRKSIRVADLDAACRQGLIAIVPIVVPSGRGHYVVVMQRASEPVVVDILHSVRPLSEGLTDEQLTAAGGFALFVPAAGRRTATQAETTPVRFEPEIVDLQHITLDGADQSSPVEFTIRLQNPSDRSVVVNSIDGTCGCISPQWRSGIIEPHAERSIPVRISRQGWGKGFSERLVAATLSDGSSAAFRIAAEGITEATLKQALQVNREQVDFDVGHAGLAPGVTVDLPETSIIVTGEPEDLANLRIDVSDPWIATAVSAIDERRQRVSIGIAVDDAVREQLRRVRRLAGRVRFFTKADDPPVVCEVAVALSSLFRLEPRSAGLERGAQQLDLILAPVHTQGPADVRVLRLTSIPDELHLETGPPADSGCRTIIVRRSEQTRERTYVVRATVESAYGDDEVYCVVVVR